MSVLYWPYNSSCSDPVDSGWIGVTEDRYARVSQLRSKCGCDVQTLILFEGTREECLDLERRLRPCKGIGWNKAVGGMASVPLKYGRAQLGSTHEAGGQPTSQNLTDAGKGSSCRQTHIGR
jgi:hypothetical protein